jgi:hypothetical protein
MFMVGRTVKCCSVLLSRSPAAMVARGQCVRADKVSLRAVCTMCAPLLILQARWDVQACWDLRRPSIDAMIQPDGKVMQRASFDTAAYQAARASSLIAAVARIHKHSMTIELQPALPTHGL